MTDKLLGLKKLLSIQDEGTRKQVEAHTIGCELIVLNTSHYKYWPETMKFLDEEYSQTIKPFIRDLNTAVAVA